MEKIGKKRQKAAKIPSKSSKICIFLKSLKSVTYAIKTFKVSIRFSLKVLSRIAADISIKEYFPALNPYHLLSYRFFILLIISYLKN